MTDAAQIFEWVEQSVSVSIKPDTILASASFMRAYKLARVTFDAEMEANIKFPLYGMRLGARNRKTKRHIRKRIQAWKKANPPPPRNEFSERKYSIGWFSNGKERV